MKHKYEKEKKGDFMKHVRKLFNLFVSFVMVFALTTAVRAEGTTYTITINNDATGHKYEAYQIFTGTLSSDKKTLSDVVWGSGITTDGQSFLQDKYATATEKSAAGVAETLTTGNAATFAKEVANYLTDIKATSTYDSDNQKYTISGLSAGYYLIKDANDSLANADDAYTAYILQVVRDVNVEPKSAKPTVDKQVQDETADAGSGAVEGWGETADHAINESFQFKLIAKLPADTDFDAYETYKVVFTDTMSEGVTFESIESVTVDGETLGVEQYSSTATSGQAGGSWTLTIADIKSIDRVDLSDGADIIVIYNAHLNEKAQVNHASGSTKNKNTVSLQYSNNPNASGKGHTELGKTPEDHVWVFTYEVDNTKVDATDASNTKPLAGAGFRLYDSTGTAEIGLIYDSTISAYRPIAENEEGQEMISASNGVFNIVGLDAGTYTLKETSVPDGYNKAADKTITISATHIEDASGTSATVTLTSDSDLTNSIENRKGATLPTTGGTGTTVMYLVGGILVIAAAVLLITNRRMSNRN
ncbi:MAG: isopeptide-forming domain-containing fimbrial protein [Bulleidia sp.]